MAAPFTIDSPPPFSPEPAESAPVAQCHQVIHETQLAITRYLQDLQARSALPLNRDLANQQIGDISTRIEDNISHTQSLAWAENQAFDKERGKNKKTEPFTREEASANTGDLRGVVDPDMAAYALKRDFLDLEAQRANLDRGQQNIETDVGEAQTLLARNEPAYGVAMMRLSTLDSVVPYYQEVNRTVQDLEQELARRRRILHGDDLGLQDPERKVNGIVQQIQEVDTALPAVNTRLAELEKPPPAGTDQSIVTMAKLSSERAGQLNLLEQLHESRGNLLAQYCQRAAEVMVGPASVEATTEELRAAHGKLPQPLTEEEGANTHVGGLANEAIAKVYDTLETANRTTEVVGLQVVDQIVALTLQARQLHADAALAVVKDKIGSLLGSVADTDLDMVHTLIRAKLQAQATQT